MFVFFSFEKILRTLRDSGLKYFVTSFEAKEGRTCLVIHLRRTTSACYRLGYCDALVNRVYKPKCEETSLEISPMLRHGDLLFG